MEVILVCILFIFSMLGFMFLIGIFGMLNKNVKESMKKTKIIIEVSSTREALVKLNQLIKDFEDGEIFVKSVDSKVSIQTKSGMSSGSDGYIF
jgi:hypothetical protein